MIDQFFIHSKILVFYQYIIMGNFDSRPPHTVEAIPVGDERENRCNVRGKCTDGRQLACLKCSAYYGWYCCKFKNKHNCSGGGPVASIVAVQKPLLSKAGSDNVILLRERISKEEALTELKKCWPSSMMKELSDFEEKLFITFEGQKFKKYFSFDLGKGCFTQLFVTYKSNSDDKIDLLMIHTDLKFTSSHHHIKVEQIQYDPIFTEQRDVLENMIAEVQENAERYGLEAGAHSFNEARLNE
ncbi:hypothetical protein FGO68_gene2821 [Halteria grandinella]|uniref:Uncharacterized protein n=1 Tax=Halteria grandinella TaxID=5974 RepID=A0A8J8NS26_HALGN|nr:hypothetical protein FGO68_gene2821 [Halteria grandinella]